VRVTGISTLIMMKIVANIGIRYRCIIIIIEEVELHDYTLTILFDNYSEYIVYRL